MNLIGIMPVRNEDWCLGFTLRVALKWCDQIIVADHGCTDGSREIMESLGRDGVIVRDDRERQWNEMEQRQMLLATARDYGATHIALIDADEFLTANLLPNIRTLAAGTRSGWMLDLPLYNVRENQFQGRPADYSKPLGEHLGLPNPFYYHANGVWGHRWVATAFADKPELHWCGDTFHHREPFGQEWRGRRSRPVSHGEGGTLHLWGASERRLRAKHQAYRMLERLRWPNKLAMDIEYTYDPATNCESELARRMGVAGPWTFASLKPEWLAGYEDLMQYLHIDAVPWQEDYVRSLLKIHGKDTFVGLNLFGLENEQ